jgi:cobalt-zinc-cadmium efflux system protein
MHDHHHPHGHNQQLNNKLIIALFLTAAVFLAELVGGYWTHSLALMSDAWHVLTDAAALGLTWVAVKQAKRQSTLKNTFGFHRLGVVAALINGISLFVIAGWILVEGIQRLWAPPAVRSQEMFIIAVIGLVANLLIAFLLNTHADNLNVKSAFLHVIGDALASLGVIAGGLLMMWLHWYAADPLISIAISLLLLRSAYKVAGEALHILMEGTPPEMQLGEMIEELRRVPGVRNIHDVHVWSVNSGIPIFTMHVIKDDHVDGQLLLNRCNLILAQKFGIFHSTIQLERQCSLTGQTTCNLREFYRESDSDHNHNGHVHEHRCEQHAHA